MADEIRKRIEAEEFERLSPYACRAAESRGRERPEEPCSIRTDFARDRDRILHCKSFRRLKHKTQVFLAPEGDHYRTRLTHTLEVSQIARTIAKALRLNEDLTEAIALGHDLGHTPFGHSGEAVLDKLCTEGFSHYQQSVRVVEKLEKDGRGLNLCWEVRDGILNHRTSGSPHTLEGQAVRYADKIAYINHDIDDAIRAGLFSEADLPAEYTEVLGHSVRERLNTMIQDLIFHSDNSPSLTMGEPVERTMRELRLWMFRTVYTGGEAKAEEAKAQHMLELLFQHYLEHPALLGGEFREMLLAKLASLPQDERYEMKSRLALERSVCDYIAGMTDDYAISRFKELFVPQGWKKY